MTALNRSASADTPDDRSGYWRAVSEGPALGADLTEKSPECCLCRLPLQQLSVRIESIAT